jgi:mRNA interferase RelE/StbE
VNSYRVSLTTSAEKELSDLPRKLISRMVTRIASLGGSPRPPGCKKLKGGDCEWRIRLGNYRVVYEIDDAAKTVEVTRIAHRREAYD